MCWLALPSIFLLIWGSWNARAQSLALVLFVSLVWLLVADARRQSRRVFLSLPLLVIWANVHGTAITGASLVVWFEHRRVLRSAGYSLATFMRACAAQYSFYLEPPPPLRTPAQKMAGITALEEQHS